MVIPHLPEQCFPMLNHAFSAMTTHVLLEVTQVPPVEPQWCGSIGEPIPPWCCPISALQSSAVAPKKAYIVLGLDPVLL